MPTISIDHKYFNQLLGKTLTKSEIDELCFNFGLEMEEDKDNDHLLKVEIPANRYDLLCVEGLVISLLNYLSNENSLSNLIKPDDFKTKPSDLSIKVDPIVNKIRPFIVSGILRNVKFTKNSYESFIDYQDKLHQNLGRKRTLVSIGTHDLDKIKGPFKYTAKKRDEFSFIPLNQNKEFTGADLLEFYKSDLHLKNYLHIIGDSEYIPLVLDSNNQVLSMPPIINSEYSKISENSKNIFIEITATDKTKALMALNVILSSFSLYSDNKFEFEQVEIQEENCSYLTPVTPLTTRFISSKSYFEKLVGMSVSSTSVIYNLSKMGLSCKEIEGDSFQIDVPFYRTDIMHPCDIAEDLAIGIGYNNIDFRDPNIICLGYQNPLNKMSELVRIELANAGYIELLNFSLCSYEDLTKKLLVDKDLNAIQISNPKTQDFQVGRTTLIPGIIKSLLSNKSNELPLKFFEIGDVMYLYDKQKDNYNFKEIIGAKNEKRISFCYSNTTTSGLDVIHGSFDLLMKKLFQNKINYKLENSSKPYFFKELQCKIIINDEFIGEMGILHPELLKVNKWPYPVSILEVNFEKLCDLYFKLNK